jgi:hypothetical protein
MTRKYKRTPGSRKYADYTAEKLELCLNSVTSGEMSQRVAAAHYDISLSTIKRRLKNNVPNKPGHPVVFTSDEERAFASHIDKVCEFGFPVDEMDFRFIVKSYLDKQGRSVYCFKNNLPGRDWAKSFLRRNPQLSVRFANNIKRARAAIDESVITEYIDNLSALTKDVSPDCIYNYDETCMSDDPGRSKIICRRGCKYPERVINSTKSNVTVMFCGNAAGTSIPPYVIYKSEHLWSTWAENGPAGARYNRSKNGWIDLAIFEEWFTTHLLPVLKKQKGKKIVIGDNLSSHLSLNVVKLCEDNDIRFVCLPPNSSHLTQPLDVAYFRPLKSKWRDILTKWKQSEAGKRVASLPKDQFPMLLRTVLDDIAPNMENNLKAGFKKAGIYPTSKDTILARLPKQDRSVNLDLVGDAFLAHLEQKRLDFVKPQVRKKKVQVAPGKSITANDIESQETKASTSGGNPTKKRKRVKAAPEKKAPPKKTLKKQDLEDSTSEDDDAYSIQDSGNSDIVLSEDYSEDEIFAPTVEPTPTNSKDLASDPLPPNPVAGEEDEGEVAIKGSIKEGNFVLVTWNNLLFPGMITSFDDDGAVVDCMERTIKGWRWPAKKDILHYKWSDITKKIGPPKLIKRGIFSVCL